MYSYLSGAISHVPFKVSGSLCTVHLLTADVLHLYSGVAMARPESLLHVVYQFAVWWLACAPWVTRLWCGSEV